MPNLFHLAFGKFIGVYGLAMVMTKLPIPVGTIFFRCCREKVHRVNAFWVVARMTHKAPFRDVPTEQHVRQPVCPPTALSCVAASKECSVPFPASARRNGMLSQELGFETILNRFFLHGYIITCTWVHFQAEKLRMHMQCSEKILT